MHKSTQCDKSLISHGHFNFIYQWLLIIELINILLINGIAILMSLPISWGIELTVTIISTTITLILLYFIITNYLHHLNLNQYLDYLNFNHQMWWVQVTPSKIVHAQQHQQIIALKIKSDPDETFNYQAFQPVIDQLKFLIATNDQSIHQINFYDQQLTHAYRQPLWSIKF